MGGADIEVGKKAGARAITSTDNNANGGNKVTDQYTGLASLVFAALGAANCTENSNFAILKRILLGAIIFTPNKFFATFTTLTNITLEREPKVYESNC